jgi:hypothetical protein
MVRFDVMNVNENGCYPALLQASPIFSCKLWQLHLYFQVNVTIDSYIPGNSNRQECVLFKEAQNV